MLLAVERNAEPEGNPAPSRGRRARALFSGASSSSSGTLASGFTLGNPEVDLQNLLGFSSEEEGGDEEAESAAEFEARTMLEAASALRHWYKMQIDWAAEFPDSSLKPRQEDGLGIESVDLMDLLPLDMGRLYFKIEKNDPNRKQFGFIPKMARTIIGALNAESFCERMLRAAGHVLTEGNTLLSSEELEKLTLLRMNRDFMIFMRQHYNKMTVVVLPK